MNSTNHQHSNLPVLVVSMTDAADRRRHISQQLQHSLMSWCFVDAINPGITPGYQWDKLADGRRISTVMGRCMTRGEHGCALSHRNIWKYLIENEISAAIVLEDDALLEENWYPIASAAHQIGGFDVLLLGYSKVPKKKSHVWFMSEPAKPVVKIQGYDICRPYRQRRSGTVGYVVTQAGAKKLLKCQNPIITVADDWPYYERNGVGIMHMRPALVYEDCVSFSSSLVEERAQLEGPGHGKMQSIRVLARIVRGCYWRMLMFFGVRENRG